MGKEVFRRGSELFTSEGSMLLCPEPRPPERIEYVARKSGGRVYLDSYATERKLQKRPGFYEIVGRNGALTIIPWTAEGVYPAAGTEDEGLKLLLARHERIKWDATTVENQRSVLRID